MHESRSEFALKRFEQTEPPTTTIREIWLPGVHSDIGGGYKESLVSNISLLTMSVFLRKLGGVALDPTNYKAALAELRSQVRGDRYVINPEPSLRRQEKRDGLIQEHDELHPLHWHLLKRRKEIFWKDRNVERTKRYINRIGRLGREDPALNELFTDWLG
jgi:hypothetical protein